MKVTMLKFVPLIRVCLFSMLLIGAPSRAANADAGKAVYHVSEAGFDQAQRTLNFVRNHTATEPGAKIVVLAHAAGIDFLLKGATTAGDVEFSPVIHELAQRGVEFRVCNLTLLSRKIDRAQLQADAIVVPSGVVELTRLQGREGYAYIRP